jgi:hypothetical protein
MLHKRRWCVSTAQPIELADKLHDHSWTLCTGLECPPGSGVYWLNDSFSEDSAQEYAVVRKRPDGQWEQVESITVSWCNKHRLMLYAENLSRTAAVAEMGLIDEPRLETADEHKRCWCCR